MKIAVVGAGIMGRLLALSLTERGHEVSLYDQGNAYSVNCSMVAAGLLAPITELDKSPDIIRILGEAALQQHWPTLLNKLSKEIYFRQTGSLVIAHPNDQQEWRRFSNRIDKRLPSSVAQKNSFYTTFTQTELAAFEPALSKFHQAHYFPSEAHIDNQQVMAAILNEFLMRKGYYYPQITIKNTQPKTLILANQQLSFDLVCDCRGVGAQAIFPDLHAIRGELICLHAPEVKLTRPVRFLHPRYSLYIVPRENDLYLVGASEIASADVSQITVRTALELLTAVYYLHPGFSEATIVKTMTQCRPTLTNYLPAIKYTDGFVAVNGLYRHGFLIAPTLVNEVMHWISDGKNVLNHPELWEQYHV